MSMPPLLTLAPDVIYAQGLPATLALHQRTHTIPIVFTQIADPFGFGRGVLLSDRSAFDPRQPVAYVDRILKGE